MAEERFCEELGNEIGTDSQFTGVQGAQKVHPHALQKDKQLRTQMLLLSNLCHLQSQKRHRI